MAPISEARPIIIAIARPNTPLCHCIGQRGDIDGWLGTIQVGAKMQILEAVGRWPSISPPLITLGVLYSNPEGGH